MRILCWYCHKNCTNELPEGTVFRAIAICPECIEKAPEVQLGSEDVSEGAKNTEQQVQPDNGGERTRPDVVDCHAKNGTVGRCMNGVSCPPLQVKS